ncbi:MAG: hypothetical protein JWL90_3049 [Chthoniobacteraceae bacterium]|nr:hypothetical protein [Chthoniobacteraceae bacterium]
MKLDIAEIKKRLQVANALAVTLESGRIVVEWMRHDTDGDRIVRSISLPSGSERVLRDPAKIGQELAALLAAEGIKERRCVVCIPPGWALTTATDVPDMNEEDLRGYLELRAEREFPIAVSDLRLAYCAYNLPDGQKRATLAAVANKRIAAVELMLENAGCRAVSISLGITGCLPKPETPAALHFLANGNHVDVVVAAGGGIVALRSIEGPVDAGENPFDAAGFCRDVRIALGSLPETVRQQVRQAHFSGASAAAETLSNEIRPQLHRMGIESLGAALPDLNTPGTAVDAARHYFKRERVAFEFVIPQVNRWQATFQRFDNKRRRMMVGAAAALILIPIIAFMVRSHIESNLETEWEGMRRNVTQLDATQQKIRQFRPWFDPTAQSVRLLEGLMSAFPDRGDVWAKSIQISNDKSTVTCTGFARTPAARLAFVETLRKRPEITNLLTQGLRGQNPETFTISFTWEPKDAK